MENQGMQADEIPDDIDKRRGVIAITSPLLTQGARTPALFQMFGRLIPLEISWTHNGIARILALSPDFEPVEEGHAAPPYVAEFNTDGGGLQGSAPEFVGFTAPETRVQESNLVLVKG